MENTQPNPMNNPVSMPASGNSHKNVGPIVATLVIVLVLIIAALYLFASRVNKEPVPTDTTAAGDSGTAVDSNQSASVPTVTGTSNDPASLQTDLNASTKNLDQQNF